VLRFLRGLLRDPGGAADATQETFARAFRRLETLSDRERLLPWLFGIARNVALEQHRASRRSGVARVDAEPPERRHDLTPEVALLGREAARVVEQALEGLSEDRRTVLLLRLDHGLAYQEIAELMGWSLAKVKVEIHRGREVLRSQLATYQGGGR
jgi:RNA polymerase sigma-70 factor (ECF subfamily)